MTTLEASTRAFWRSSLNVLLGASQGAVPEFHVRTLLCKSTSDAPRLADAAYRSLILAEGRLAAAV